MVLSRVRRCLRTRVWVIFSRIWDGVGMFFRTFLWHFLCQKTCDRSSPPAASKLFGAHFWHALGTKSALTRKTHPQHSFSKGGGSAKRPQFAVPQRGAGVVLNGSVKSAGPGRVSLPYLPGGLRKTADPFRANQRTALFSTFFRKAWCAKKR